MKICKVCNQEKYANEYYTWNKVTCRKCIYQRGKIAVRKWAKNNKEKHKEYTKKISG